MQLKIGQYFLDSKEYNYTPDKEVYMIKLRISHIVEESKDVYSEEIEEIIVRAGYIKRLDKPSIKITLGDSSKVRAFLLQEKDSISDDDLDTISKTIENNPEEVLKLLKQKNIIVDIKLFEKILKTNDK